MTTKPRLLAVDDHAVILDALKLTLGDRVEFLGITEAQIAGDELGKENVPNP